MLDGEGNDLRELILREVRVRRRLVRKAEEWSGLLPESLEQAAAVFQGALGEDRVVALRQALGLPAASDADRPIQAQLAAPRPNDALPVVYRRLFSDQALEAGDLLTGRQTEVERVRAALRGTHGGILRTAALLGLHEAGVGAAANAAIRGMRGDRVRRIDLDGPVTVREVDEWFDPGDRDRVFVVSGLRWLFSMRAGGFEPLRRFIHEVMNDGGRNAWLMIADVAVWRYAARLAPLDSAFEVAVELGAMDVEELSTAILSRHAMSGYDLQFEADDDLGWQLQNLLLRVSDREARQREAWFRTLHEASAGVMHDALRLWMASIRVVDDKGSVIHIGSVERPPVARLGGMSEDVHLTLLQVLRQGWMSADLYAGLFRVDREDARAHLGALAHRGLLVVEDGHYRVATHLRAPIWRVLQARGWAA